MNLEVGLHVSVWGGRLGLSGTIRDYSGPVFLGGNDRAKFPTILVEAGGRVPHIASLLDATPKYIAKTNVSLIDLEAENIKLWHENTKPAGQVQADF